MCTRNLILLISILLSFTTVRAQYSCYLGSGFPPSESVPIISIRSINEIYRVPIVFHIVGNENFINSISNDALEEQLEYVNEVFSGTNNDLINVRAEFESVVGIANIEFYISEIVYQKSDKQFIGSTFLSTQSNLEDVKQNNKDGSDPIDIDKYLNIWICDVQQSNGNQSGGGSYATPPIGAPGWPIELESLGLIQGIVLNDNNLLENLKVLVHEMGHYLGLRHIIEFSSDPCEDTDGIEDTPVVFQATECRFRDTCSGPGSDMEENFMNPQVLSCRNAFTHGQVDRMRFILEEFRADLFQIKPSSNHIPSEEVFIFSNVTENNFTVSFSDCDMKRVTIRVFTAQGILLEEKRMVALSLLNLEVDYDYTSLLYINIQYQGFSKTLPLIKL